VLRQIKFEMGWWNGILGCAKRGKGVFFLERGGGGERSVMWEEEGEGERGGLGRVDFWGCEWGRVGVFLVERDVELSG